MGILTIQSQVVAGFVGNAAATFVLQRLGTEVWALPTLLLSNHPGHGVASGGSIPAELMTSLLDGLEAFDCFAQCDAVISGYLNSGDNADCVMDAVSRMRSNGTGFYLCDPVMGDDGRTYVKPDVVAAVHNLAAIADIITPNAYELSLLSGISLTSRSDALRAMRLLQAYGPSIVLLSSFSGADTPADMIDVFVMEGTAAWLIGIPKLKYKFSGAGDTLAALFLHFWLKSKHVDQAASAACSALFGVLRETINRGTRELALIEAQQYLFSPDCYFSAERII